MKEIKKKQQKNQTETKIVLPKSNLVQEITEARYYPQTVQSLRFVL